MASNLNIHSKLVKIFASHLFHNGITRGTHLNKTPVLLAKCVANGFVKADNQSTNKHKTRYVTGLCTLEYTMIMTSTLSLRYVLKVIC